MATALRIQQATNGHQVTVLGARLLPGDYLAALYALSMLLTHLARADDTIAASWAVRLRADPHTDVTRCSSAPIQDVPIRSALFAAVDAILAAPNMDAAATMITPWLANVPRGGAGPRAWVRDNTHHTTLTEGLTDRAAACQPGISWHLHNVLARTDLPASAIPQCLPTDLYADLYADLLDEVLPETGRIYASLCCARTLPGITGWISAGNAIGISPATSRQTPMTVSPHLHDNTAALLGRTRLALQRLSPEINYRHREDTVTRLFEKPQSWYEQWRSSYTPRGKHHPGIEHACEWFWRDYARAAPCTQAWSAHWDNQQRYRFMLWQRRTVQRNGQAPQMPTPAQLAPRSACRIPATGTGTP